MVFQHRVGKAGVLSFLEEFLLESTLEGVRKEKSMEEHFLTKKQLEILLNGANNSKEIQ
jgi:hypothetical protein